jgi:hypothetical protein
MTAQRVVLYSLIDITKFGGSAVYTAHLYKALELAGFAPLLVRVGARTSKRWGEFTHGVPCWTVSLVDALRMARDHAGIIVYTHWRTHATQTAALVRAGVPVVVHDPAQLDDGFVALLQTVRPRVVAIRKQGVAMLRHKGIAAAFIPHPYVPCGAAGQRAAVVPGQSRLS